MRIRYFKVSLVAGFILVSLMSLFGWSFMFSRTQAVELVQRIPDAHTKVNEGFHIQRLSNGAWEPHWFFSFEPDAYFVTAPITIEYSIFCKAIGSNPPGALDLILALPPKQKQPNNAITDG